MRYLCMVYFDEAAMEALSPEAYADLARQCREGDADLEAKGQLVFASPLDRVKNARTVRLRDGRLSTTDGPFAETKEQLGGFIVVEADSIDTALAVAERSPFAKLGCVEVREMRDPGHRG